jgi:hypothetical protein
MRSRNSPASAQAVKSAVEASGGGFAKASTVVGVFAAKVKNTENAIRAQIAALKASSGECARLAVRSIKKQPGKLSSMKMRFTKASGAADDAGVE